MNYTVKSENWKKRWPHHSIRKFISKKLETAEMSLNGVLQVIFEVEKEEEEKE